MLIFGFYWPDGSYELVDKLDGYLELSFTQSSFSVDQDGKFSLENQSVGLHKCNQYDRSHFYDKSD